MVNEWCSDPGCAAAAVVIANGFRASNRLKPGFASSGCFLCGWRLAYLRRCCVRARRGGQPCAGMNQTLLELWPWQLLCDSPLWLAPDQLLNCGAAPRRHGYAGGFSQYFSSIIPDLRSIHPLRLRGFFLCLLLGKLTAAGVPRALQPILVTLILSSCTLVITANGVMANVSYLPFVLLLFCSAGQKHPTFPTKSMRWADFRDAVLSAR